MRTRIGTPDDAPRAEPSHGAKLRKALDYLGDRLSTHRTSRYKPARRYLLDAWLASRIAART